MKVLAIDVGGTNVQVLASGRTEVRRIESGPTLTAQPGGRWREEADREQLVRTPSFVPVGRPEPALDARIAAGGRDSGRTLSFARVAGAVFSGQPGARRGDVNA